MIRTCSRTALLAVMIVALVTLLAVGGVAADGETLSVTQDDTTTAITPVSTDTGAESSAVRPVILEATTAASVP